MNNINSPVQNGLHWGTFIGLLLGAAGYNHFLTFAIPLLLGPLAGSLIGYYIKRKYYDYD